MKDQNQEEVNKELTEGTTIIQGQKTANYL